MNTKKCIWNGEPYDSIKLASDDTGHNYNDLRGWVALGLKSDSEVQEYHAYTHTSECENCGAVFTSIRSGVRYCSDSCRKQHWHETRAIRNQMRKLSGVRIPNSLCYDCGKRPRYLPPSGYMASYCTVCMPKYNKDKKDGK